MDTMDSRLTERSHSDSPPPRLPLLGAGHREAAVNEPPPAKHPILRLLRKPFFWALALFLAVCGYQWWRVYDYRLAVDEAKAAGFEWRADETFDLIRQDWLAALRKETWGTHERILIIGDPFSDNRGAFDLAPHRDLFHRLRPTGLLIYQCENVDALNGLHSLQRLSLQNCPTLQNLDALKGLTGLQELELADCPALQNLDALKDLTRLQELYLWRCPKLQNLDALKSLPHLQTLSIFLCPNLEKVSVLKNFTGLQRLRLGRSSSWTDENEKELREALPNTQINFDILVL